MEAGEPARSYHSVSLRDDGRLDFVVMAEVMRSGQTRDVMLFSYFLLVRIFPLAFITALPMC